MEMEMLCPPTGRSGMVCGVNQLGSDFPSTKIAAPLMFALTISPPTFGPVRVGISCLEGTATPGIVGRAAVAEAVRTGAGVTTGVGVTDGGAVMADGGGVLWAVASAIDVAVERGRPFGRKAK